MTLPTQLFLTGALLWLVSSFVIEHADFNKTPTFLVILLLFLWFASIFLLLGSLLVLIWS